MVSIPRVRLCLLVGYCARLAVAAPLTLEGDLRAHDPSRVVRCGERYWLFRTGRLCPAKSSADLRTWREEPAAFGSPPAWWQTIVPGFDGYVWAPDVVRVGDRWWLFYSVSKFGQNSSAIGVATAATLDPQAPGAGWSDGGCVLRSGPGDDFNAIDPAPLLATDGRLWLAFGSFWSGILLVELDPASGLRLHPAEAPRRLAAPPTGQVAVEACYLYQRGDWHYLFVNWGYCCRGVDSSYEVRVGRSRTVFGPYVDRAGQDLAAGGGSLFLGRQGDRIGPGHVGILCAGEQEWCSYHYYDGAHSGRATLGPTALRWDADGWPVVD